VSSQADRSKGQEFRESFVSFAIAKRKETTLSGFVA
jgi:hypothetical protein